MLDSQIETVAQQHPLEMRAAFRKASPGDTIADIVAAHHLPTRFGAPKVILFQKDRHWPVPVDCWARVRPKAGTRIEIGYPVHGPAIAAIGSAIVTAAAPTIAGTILGVTSGLAFNLLVAGITIVGALAINALITPPSQSRPQEDDPNFAITGVSNQENRYGIYPKVLGRHRIFPPLTARGYTESRGRENIFYRGRMTFGWGPVALEDMRIGTTPITEFDGIELEFVNVDEAETLALSPELAGITRAWRSGSENLQLMPDNITEDPYNVKLNQNEPVIRATRDRTESASLDITFPQGFVQYPNGDALPVFARFEFDYRKLGEAAWISAGAKVWTGYSSALQRFTWDFDFPEEAEWELRVTRTSQTFDEEPAVRDASFMTAIRSRRTGGLPSHDGVAEMAFKIKASDELNGRVETLNVIAHQMVPVWDGAAWTVPQRNRHPAWIYADALRGPHLRRPVEDARIALDDLKAWADEEPHWTCDFIIDTPQRVSDTLDLICAVGRAKKTLADLKYSVIRDGAQGPIRQVFTPRNSWGFRGSVAFPRDIHALRCIVVSERLDWQRDELTVYADGYDIATATEFETLDLPGVVITEDDMDEGNGWRLGRYHLAQAILRPEQYEFNVDWEAMKSARGDKAQIVHDVPAMGVGAGRVKSIDADGMVLNAITLDEVLDVVAGDYRITVRDETGERQVFTASVGAAASVSSWVYASGEVDAERIAVGDLVAVERMDQETVEILITGVFPNADASARITAVPASPAVLDADTGFIPNYAPVVTDPVSNPNFGPPEPDVRNLVSDQTTALLERGGTLQARAAVSLNPVLTRDRAGVSVQARWRNTGGEESWEYGDLVPQGSAAVYTRALVTGDTYEVWVRSIGEVSAFRRWVLAGTVVASVSDGPPSDVTGWQVVPSEGFAQMQWADPSLFDLSHLEIRYTSGVSANWNASTLLSKVPYPKLNESLFARAGTYMAKWVDRGGQKSVNAAAVTITDAQLKAANAVETLVVSPSFAGTLVDTEVNASDQLQLVADGNGEYPSEGTWTGSTVVDLGASYPVRITPIIDATAFSANDAMANWTSLAALASLAPSNPDAWAITVEVAFSTTDPTAGTNWQPLTGGDYVGRYFNFRVTLKTDRADTTPQISELRFVLDMPDRVEGMQTVASGTGGLSVVYAPAFNAVPAVVVTPVNAPSGAYHEVTNETRQGFDIEFFDQGGASINVTFNWVARGYGREQ